MNLRTCKISAEEIAQALESERVLYLATCADNHVTIRPMSHVHVGRDVYFQTGADSLKMRQIAVNPRVALCVGTYELEGIAIQRGHPLAEENAFFARAYQKKHPVSFEKYTSLEDEVLLQVKVSRVRQWRYIQDEPCIAETVFESR